MLDKIKKALKQQGDEKKEEEQSQDPLSSLASDTPAPASDLPAQPGALGQEPSSTVPSPSQQAGDAGGLSDTQPSAAEDVSRQSPPEPTAPQTDSTVADLAKPVEPPVAPEEDKKDVLGQPVTQQPVTPSVVEPGPKEDLSVAPEPSVPMPSEVTPQEPTTPSVEEVTPSPSGAQPTQPQDTMPEPSTPPVGPTTSQPGAVGVSLSSQAADEELKKTHEPVLVLPDRLEMGQMITVKVKVGMIPHVMEDAHYVQSIELFANDASVGKVDLNPRENKIPEADFQVSLAPGMKIKAVVYCNVHGKWEYEQVLGKEQSSPEQTKAL